MSSSSDDEAPPQLVPVAAAPTGAPSHAEDVVATGAAKGTDATRAAGTVPPPPVPVALITGFLGAGKSTLVNHILTAKHGYRCAVLLNEWADSADIEKALIKEPEASAGPPAMVAHGGGSRLGGAAVMAAAEGRALSCCGGGGGAPTDLAARAARTQGSTAAPLADWVQLENGCICCSVKSDMVKALESLLQQRERFDYILIETTGLANPGPVAAALWTDAELESGVCLDAIVTVVDARLIRRQLAEPRPEGAVNEAQQQVAFADVVLLNKTDLVGSEELAATEAELRGVNAEAGIVRCERCAIDLGLILNTGIYTAGARGPAPAAAAGGAAARGEAAAAGEEAEHEHGPDCGPSCSQPANRHGRQQQQQPAAPHRHAIGTVTLHEARPLSLPRLRHWLDELLWEESGEATADFMRIKGLLSVAGSTHKQVIQGVHELYDVLNGPAWGAGERRASKLVFIGRRLDAGALAAGLARCGAADGEGG
eukprot:scaffold8.g1389.t1